MDILIEKRKNDIRKAKIFAEVMMILFAILAVVSFIYAFLTKGKSLSFEIFLSSSVIAIVAWFLFSNLKELDRKIKKPKRMVNL